LALNYILASQLAAFTTSYAYLKSNSVDTDMFVKILTAGPLNTTYPYFQTWANKIEGKKYDDIAFSLEGVKKDVGLYLNQAKKSNIDTTQIEGTYQLYDKAVTRSPELSEKDLSSLFEQVSKKPNT